MRMPEQTLLPGVGLRAFDDYGALCGDLAEQVAGRLRESIRERGKAVLVVSGGSTPVGFFQVLAGLEVAWARVTVVPSDERWVAADDDQRNSRMIRQYLLQGPAAEARLLELAEEEDQTPEQAAANASQRLDELHWPADVVVLGMGDDGHTASLFPDAPELPGAMAPDSTAVVVTSPGSQSRRRLTLSARMLAGARMTVLLIRGSSKRDSLDRVIEEPLAIGPMPVRYFLHQPMTVFWSP